LLSAVGFVVFFKLVFAARVSWRHGAPAGLRALAATTILPAGGLIGPGVGAWSAGAEKPSLGQLARSTVTFALLSSAPAVVALATLGTLLWLGMPGGPHQAALTILPASLAAVVIGAIWLAGRASPLAGRASPLAGRASRRRRLRRPHGRLASAVGSGADGVADAEALLRAGDWKLLGSLAYFAFDGAVLWAAFHAYGHTPPIGVIGMGYLVGSLAGALPLPAGLGAVDGGLIGALALYGAPLAPAAAAVLLYRGISLSLPIALGAAAWMWSPATRTTEGRRVRPGQRARARRRAAAAELATARAQA
ncbi:MAG: putative heme transporter, partial [Solirubrobacteraceae bacterium]|nr:putative heme transporter [Solirubrobacteraceae bacterium]